MAGLVLFMVGRGQEHRAEPIEAQHAIRLGIVDSGVLARRFQAFVVGLAVVEGPRRVADAQLRQQPLLDAGHQRGDLAALLEPLLEVLRLQQLGLEPAVLECLRVCAQLVALAAGGQRVERGLGGQHAGLDRGVAALDPRGIEVAGLAADQRAAREHGPGQRQDAAGGDGTRAIGDALAALQVPADRRMGLEALELLERTQPRVAVVQPDDEADGDLAAFGVVQERAAVGVAVQRPAGGMHHQPRLVPGRVDLPQLLDADAVGLRVLALIQLVAFDQLAAEVAARALGEDGVLGVQLHAALEIRARGAILVDAHVAGGHAHHRAVVVVQHLGGGEAREDRHLQRLGLLRQPAGHFAEADDEVALVVEAAGQQDIRGAPGAGFAQEQEFVAGDGLLQWRAALGPVREQFAERAWVHDRAGQDVRTRLGAFLQHAHRQLLPLLHGQLAQADGGGQPGRAGADDHHVELHRLARRKGGGGFCVHAKTLG